MCGIAGFIGQGTLVDIEKMTTHLYHRGPDDRGVFFDGGVALGHTRLSIIDLSQAGHQPMFSEDKKIAIVFNGEIYNFQELKKELELTGVHFKSTSDTEVIIALYQKFGEKCFEKMNGMFAIGLYDFQKSKLILARDRLGKKPLYWAVFGETLIFASELKSLTLHPLCQKEIDPVSLSLYLQTDFVPTPRTIFKNIFKLEPASYLIYENGKVEKEIFWSLESREQDISFSGALKKLDKYIEESVKSRLVSDVPLGVFLSGGLDSSTVAYYAQKNSSQKIQTFSIGFNEKSFDESYYAEKVSKHLGTNHHHKNFSARDSLDLIPHIADILDEPLADASVLPTYLLSCFAKESVTVALGGDGGDELFAGYPTFQADKLVSFYKILPDFIKQFIKIIINNIPDTDSNFSWGFKLKKFINGISDDRFLMHQKWLGTFSGEDLTVLLKNGVKGDTLKDYTEEVKKNIKIEDKDNALLSFYMKTYLIDEVLVKVDRASMAASLETRSPFLDYKLVEFVNSLPYSYKIKGLTTKYILKKLMSDKLPSEIVQRQKKGFGVPMAKWLREDMRPLCEELLSEPALERQGIFNHQFVKTLLDDHFAHKSDNRKKIWNLLVFQLWFNKYLKT